MRIKSEFYFKIIIFFLLNCFLLSDSAMPFPEAYAAASKGQSDTLSARINIYAPEIQAAFSRSLTPNFDKTKLSVFPYGTLPETHRFQNRVVPGKKGLVLFICNENEERSPMAARLLRQNMSPDLASHYEVKSAGMRLSTVKDPVVSLAIARHRLLRDRIPRKADDTLLNKARIIFVMTRGQRTRLQKKYPEIAEKIFLLMGEKQKGLRAVEADYAGKSYNVLENTISRRLSRIEEILREILARDLGQSRPVQANSMNVGFNRSINAAI